MGAKEVDFAYFPVKSTTTIDDENSTVSVNFTMPNCGGTWDVALIVDQTPIGGDVFELWSLDNLEQCANASRASTGCDGLDGSQLASLIDDKEFEEKFTTFTGFAEDDLNLTFTAKTCGGPTSAPTTSEGTASPTT